MVVVFGVAGFRDHDGVFRFHPRAPRRFEGLRFPMTLRGQWLEVEIRNEVVRYELREGDGLEIFNEDEKLLLRPGQPVTRPLRNGADARATKEASS